MTEQATLHVFRLYDGCEFWVATDPQHVIILLKEDIGVDYDPSDDGEIVAVPDDEFMIIDSEEETESPPDARHWDKTEKSSYHRYGASAAAWALQNGPGFFCGYE